MKLNTEQIGAIGHYLNRMELFQLDLRDEVLDHMATSIETKMTSGIPFKEAFQQETQKWKKDLDNYSSYWLGLLWSGPKIVIEKCVKLVQKIYLKASIVSIVVLGIIHGLHDLISITFLEKLSDTLGFIYIVFFLLLLFLRNKIQKSNYKSSYGFLFKIQTISFGMLFILYNPLLTDILCLIKDGAIQYISLFMHAFTLAFSYFFYEFYKSHLDIQKLISA